MFVENHIYKYRKKYGYTQSQLAVLCECSQKTISDIERYRHEPSLLLSLKMSDVFHCRIEDIFNVVGFGYYDFLKGVKK